MDTKRWAGRLAFIALVAAATVFPDWKTVAAEAAPQTGVVDITMLVLMALGLGVAAYGFCLERHKLRAYLRRRLHVQLRLARPFFRLMMSAHATSAMASRPSRRVFIPRQAWAGGNEG